MSKLYNITKFYLFYILYINKLSIKLIKKKSKTNTLQTQYFLKKNKNRYKKSLQILLSLI